MATREEAAGAQVEDEGAAEQAVTPLELFFDLVFVFAITQAPRARV